MPRNFKEEMIFTIMMAGLMVLVMTMYNVTLQNGLSDGWIMESLLGFPPALIFALIIDLIVVGPIAKKIAFSVLPENAKMIQIGLTISVLMILGMVTIMSLFGMIVAGQFNTDHLFLTYAHTWSHNIIVALPLQLVVVGPLSRAVLAKVQLSADNKMTS